MFNWLQHLFTARALQRENSELSAKIKDLQGQIEMHNEVITVKDKEISSLKSNVSKLQKQIESHKTPPYDFTKSAATGSRTI